MTISHVTGRTPFKIISASVRTCTHTHTHRNAIPTPEPWPEFISICSGDKLFFELHSVFVPVGAFLYLYEWNIDSITEMGAMQLPIASSVKQNTYHMMKTVINSKALMGEMYLNVNLIKQAFDCVIYYIFPNYMLEINHQGQSFKMRTVSSNCFLKKYSRISVSSCSFFIRHCLHNTNTTSFDNHFPLLTLLPVACHSLVKGFPKFGIRRPAWAFTTSCQQLCCHLLRCVFHSLERRNCCLTLYFQLCGEVG